MKWSRSRSRRRPVALLTALASCASLLGLAAAQPAAASGTELSGAANLGVQQQVLFRSGTAGYGCFRIPTLTTTKNGTLLAFAEARTSPSCADRGPIDIVVRRSTNEGRTWSPIRVVSSGRAGAAGPAQVRGNPSPVADVMADKKGTVFLFSNSEPAVPGGTRTSWVQRSDDDGLTFQAPTAVPRLTTGTGWFGTGPSHGIQILKKDHPHEGRMVVGAYETVNGDDQRVGVLYSDDRGASWKSSLTEDSFLRAKEVPGVSTAPDPYRKDWGPESPVAKPGEPVVAELADGSVYVSARSPYDVRVNTTLPAAYEDRHRMHVTATEAVDPVDGQTKVKVPRLGYTQGWVGPDVQVSVLAPRRTYRTAPGDLLLMSSPSHPDLRQEMRIRYSLDDGATWKDAPGGQVSKVLGDRAGYSDMAELSAGDIGMVYEGGTSFSAQHIYFNRFTVDQLRLPEAGTFAAKGAGLPQQAPAAGRTSPDTTVEANDAYLGNGTASGPGAAFGGVTFGQGLKLNGGAGGTKGHADLPWTASLNGGSGDMTYSLFFRYDATSASPQQALLWAYGVGDPKQQVWARVQPEYNRVMARVEGDKGAVTLTFEAPLDKKATPAFGDGVWHHLVLTRKGAEIKLGVDGLVPAVKSFDVGRLAPWRKDDVQGIRLGDKLDTGIAEVDANDGFTGTLDEFRLYREAVDPTLWPALRGAGRETVAPASLKAHLPFEVVDTAGAAPLTNVRIQDDVSGRCADGTLLGTRNPESAQVPGRVGGAALAVSKDLPGVEVPYVPAVDNGTGDFTFALWFQYDSAVNPEGATLLSAYGSTDGKPSLWVGAKPSTKRLHARAVTTSASVTIDLEDTKTGRAFGDKEWHLLTLTRAGDTLTMRVDGEPPATATGLTGSFTDGVAAPEGVRIGSKRDATGTKPEGIEILTGQLDDFRFYPRALSDAERADILDTTKGGWAPALKPAPTVWWTMEGGNTEQHLVMRPADDPAARSTFDASSQCNNALVRGGATVTDADGRFGRGLGFDGVDDSVELPYGEAEALGDGDFTLAAWVRYQAAENDEPVLVRAYGVGTTERQLWIRARTGTNDVVAHVQTDQGITSLVARAPENTVFGDGTWRHVVLRRDSGELTLSIGDGTRLLATASGAVAGSLTYQDGFDVQGILLGTRPDALPKDWFQGSMDEFTLVRRFLTDDEIKAVGAPLPADGSTVVRLPFDTITPQGTHVRL
ncbi:LamG-like jellyroll fold domain-containing protein [Streptomyces sp. NPDC127092]|uniref:LamG-like jellyroll fold domain-containing protein n=1 Tax=Streptomyces sp. NPDC127092 TaxID=3347135 RepID=UPI00364BBA28